MPSDNLDDLFRQQLGQHATPPSADLQRRLAELAEAERLDTLFRTGLGNHASQPRRELWERLEDEHLHPQPRRRRGVVAWWQLSAAAMLLLALLAGGLWRGGYLEQRPGLAVGGPAAQPSAPEVATSAGPAATAASSQKANKNLATTTIAQSEKKNQKNLIGQATASRLVPSSNPIATTTRPRRTATVPRAASSSHLQPRQPDAAAGKLATTGWRNSPASQPHQPTPRVAPETPGTSETPTQVAVVVVPPAPAGIIEVDVRRGPGATRPAAPVAPVVAAATPGLAADQPQRRLRLGGLLRQADHLVHGEPVSLAEATGLPESLTVQARLGGRTISKTIQL